MNDLRTQAGEAFAGIELEPGDGRCLYCAERLVEHDTRVIEGKGILVLCPNPPGKATVSDEG